MSDRVDRRGQRGFVLPALAPYLTIALVLAGVVIWGLWQERARVAADRDAWQERWTAQAELTRRQALYGRAADEAAQRAQVRVEVERESAARYRREISRIATTGRPEDPCLQMLLGSMCRAVAGDIAQRLREHAARITGAAVPDAAGAPDPSRAGATGARGR